MAVKYTNNAKSTLASGINSSVTSATVADGSIFPALGAGEYFYITFDDGSNNEIAKVTARSGNTLTIVRAQDNTTARAFSTGDSAELRIIAAVLTEIQENIAAKSANQTVYSATAASNATAYNIGVDPGVEANASVFLDGVYQHHDTFSFSGSTLTFDAPPTNGTKIEVVVDNLINLQSSNLTVDTFTATSGQTAFTLSDAPGGEANVLAFIDGVFQNQAAFTLSSNTLTFDTGVVVGRSVTVYTINPVNIGTPSDSTVTSAKLTGNITLPGSLTVGAYDVAFDSPTFVVDHSNSRVGLGTATPSVPVDIVGEAKISSHFTILDAGSLKVGTGADVIISSDGTNGTLAGPNGNFTIDVAGDIHLDADGGDIVLKDGGTHFGSIYQNSNNMLIYSAISNADMLFQGNDSDGSNPLTALTLDMSAAGAATFNSDVTTGGKLTVSDGGNATVAAIRFNAGLGISSPSTDQLNFITDDTTRVIIDSAGRVGIGVIPYTTNNHGDMELQFDSNFAIGGSYAVFGEVLSSQATIVGNNIRPVIGTNSQIMRHQSAADAGNFMAITYNKGFTFHTGITTTQGTGVAETQNERVRIDTTGRVGIGVNDPDQLLDVAGNIRIPNGGKIVFGSSGTTPGDYLMLQDVAAGSNLLELVQDTANKRLVVEGVTGNVGINIDSADTKLHVDVNSATVGTDALSVANRGVTTAGSTPHTTGMRFQFNTAVPAAIRSKLTNTSNGQGSLSLYTSTDGSAGNLTEAFHVNDAQHTDSLKRHTARVQESFHVGGEDWTKTRFYGHGHPSYSPWGYGVGASLTGYNKNNTEGQNSSWYAGVRINGYMTWIPDIFIPYGLGQVYGISCTMFQHANATAGTSVMYVGLIGYDKDFNFMNHDGIGTYQYNLASSGTFTQGAMQEMDVTLKGWQGNGATDGNKMDRGTVYVRPMMLINYPWSSSNGGTTPSTTICSFTIAPKNTVADNSSDAGTNY